MPDSTHRHLFSALLRAVMALLPLAASAERIQWLSPVGSVNQTSEGQAMDGGFRFELGVFANGFVPTAANTSEWAQHWRAAQRVSYQPFFQWFTGQFQVTANPAPFTVGRAAYVWGFRGDPVSSEWILFRRSTWNWPAPNEFNPFALNWSAQLADQVILGSIEPTGSPFLMRSAKVEGVSPPTTGWSQWLADLLPGHPASGPQDDPDGDGIPNALEYVYGSSPLQAGAAPALSVAWREIDGLSYWEIAIPRRRDRKAQLLAAFSEDLQTWQSGPGVSVIVEDGPSLLRIRSLTPRQDHARRFFRLEALPQD